MLRSLVRAGGSTKLWGGRFSRDVDDAIKQWADSSVCDRRMAVEDMWGSLAHVTMLGKQGVIPAADAGKILGGLLELQNDYIAGKWELSPDREDVHLNVEGKLIDKLGLDIAGKMHTTRSRNDQVVLDSKLYTRKRLLEIREKVGNAVEAFLERAAPHLNDVMVAYTHVQHAQPVSVAFWLSHYAAVMLRDMERFKRAYDVTDQNPLGSGAISTTSFPIDRQLTTDLLGFQQVHEHALDATSARDFMLETLSSNAILSSTMSRFAEEVILWTSYEFRSLALDDGFAMGSSMMPQKKNPGSLELLRGRAGRISGLLSAGMTMMKGLPSGYNRDFHEEKEILWESLDLTSAAVGVVPPVVKTTHINLKRMEELAGANFATATELANFLVRKGVNFRKAHHIVGSLVGELYRAGQSFAGNFDKCVQHVQAAGVAASSDEIVAVLDPKKVMQSYNVLGGTGPKAVAEAMDRMRGALAKHRATLAADKQRVEKAYAAARAIAAESGKIASKGDIEKLVAKYHPLGK